MDSAKLSSLLPDKSDKISLLNLVRSDSKSLLWNVSTCDEEDDDNIDHADYANFEQLQHEIELLRKQLKSSQNETKKSQQIAADARTRELDTINAKAQEVFDLNQTVQLLQSQMKASEEEHIAMKEDYERKQRETKELLDLSQERLAETDAQFAKQEQTNKELELQYRQTVQDLKATKALLEGTQAVDKDLEQQKQVNNELAAELKEAKDLIAARLEEDKIIKEELACQLQKAKKEVITNNNMTDNLMHQKQENEKLALELKTAKEALVLKLEQEKKANEECKELKSQYMQAVQDLKATKALLEGTQSVDEDLQQQKQANKELAAELKEAKDLLTARLEEDKIIKEELACQLQKAKEELKNSNNMADTLVHQKQENEKLAFELKATKDALSVKLEQDEQVNEELAFQLKEAKEDSNSIAAIQEELEVTRTGMEHLLGIMQDSEKELMVLREELTAAKQALAESTGGMDLGHAYTSMSSTLTDHNTPPKQAPEVQVLQKELAQMRKELYNKEMFIQDQITTTKSKLMNYVQTKEDELEETKHELAQTKQALQENNTSIRLQLKETKQELEELTSIKEKLVSSLHDLESKNSLMSKQLEQAKDQLALLAATRKELQDTKQDLSTTNMKLWTAFAMFAAFVGHRLMEAAKAKFLLKSKPENNQSYCTGSEGYAYDFDRNSAVSVTSAAPHEP